MAYPRRTVAKRLGAAPATSAAPVPRGRQPWEIINAVQNRQVFKDQADYDAVAQANAQRAGAQPLTGMARGTAFATPLEQQRMGPAELARRTRPYTRVQPVGPQHWSPTGPSPQVTGQAAARGVQQWQLRAGQLPRQPGDPGFGLQDDLWQAALESARKSVGPRVPDDEMQVVAQRIYGELAGRRAGRQREAAAEAVPDAGPRARMDQAIQGKRQAGQRVTPAEVAASSVSPVIDQHLDRLGLQGEVRTSLRSDLLRAAAEKGYTAEQAAQLLGVQPSGPVGASTTQPDRPAPTTQPEAGMEPPTPRTESQATTEIAKARVRVGQEPPPLPASAPDPEEAETGAAAWHALDAWVALRVQADGDNGPMTRALLSIDPAKFGLPSAVAGKLMAIQRAAANGRMDAKDAYGQAADLMQRWAPEQPTAAQRERLATEAQAQAAQAQQQAMTDREMRTARLADWKLRMDPVEAEIKSLQSQLLTVQGHVATANAAWRAAEEKDRGGESSVYKEELSAARQQYTDAARREQQIQMALRRANEQRQALVREHRQIQGLPDPGEQGPQSGSTIDEATARAILREAGGDKDRAREIARQRGYAF